MHALPLSVDLEKVHERGEGLRHDGIVAEGRHGRNAEQRPHHLHQQTGAGVAAAHGGLGTGRLLVVHLVLPKLLEEGVAGRRAAELVLELHQTEENRDERQHLLQSSV